ncbi:MAG: ATP-dependent RecD-like DNA helicase [Deltaproteobacteria bacterium]|nr:ATP-dependent RecD-like DNA helicase [Deltaproteobacteria bacterium]
MATIKPDIIIEGAIERITYSNEDTAWSVIKLQVAGCFEPVTVVGNLMSVQPGENLRIVGDWVNDKKYGLQFKAQSYTTIIPANIAGIKKYLGSGMIKGLGPVMAERLVKQFGINTLDIIENHFNRLSEVEGIGQKRSQMIKEAWEAQKQIREVMVFLQGHGVSTTLAVKIFKRYGQNAIEVVKENPYRLALEIFGIGFLTADKIARNLGISLTSPQRAEAGVFHVLNELADEGHVCYPRPDLITYAAKMLEIEDEIIDTAISKLVATEHLVVERSHKQNSSSPKVFLKSLHVAEAGIAKHLSDMMQMPVTPVNIDIERAITWIEQQQNINLANAQREAIRRSIVSKVLVVTGGPGTGKTTLVNSIIRILEKKGRRILLAAPTGRAAKRMSEATGYEAKTIHRLLEFSPKNMSFQRDNNHPLPADMVIIDEASMIDTIMAYHLVKAIPLHAQLIMVGDIDQLPSVGPGNVLKDIIKSDIATLVRLQQIFRQAERSLIVVNAHRINHGEMPFYKSNQQDADFYFIERQEPEEVLATIKSVVKDRLRAKWGFDSMRDVQVLTPMHRGLLGAGNLNIELQSLLNPQGSTIVRGSRILRVGDKVMQIRNNYNLDVYNGDIGYVVGIDAVEQLIFVSFDGRRVAYEYADSDELVLAYACSVHKAQGSEYPCIVMPLHTQHYMMLQRNLLYTGITRGKKIVIVIGSKKALAIAVHNAKTKKRVTMLVQRLQNCIKKISA